MKMAFKECNYTIEETKTRQHKNPFLTKDTQNQTFWIIGSVILITSNRRNSFHQRDERQSVQSNRFYG